MKVWRELMVLCTAGRVFERRAGTGSLRAIVSDRALRLLGPIDRRQRVGPAEDADNFAPDTDIQVFFVDSEPVAAPDAARMGKAL